jgi:hypothetical protein
VKSDPTPFAMEAEPTHAGAVLVAGSDSAAASDNVARLLDFFGVGSRSISGPDFLRERADKKIPAGTKLFCSSETFLEVFHATQAGSDQPAAGVLHSVFVFAGQNADSLLEVTKLLVEDASVLSAGIGGGRELRISEDAEFCGAMAGLTIRTSANRPSQSIKVPQARPIISVEDGALFFRLEWRGIPVFITAGTEIIDLDHVLSRGTFDIRQHALAALPAVLYIKWAFADSCWQAAEANACVVIDDPLLRPQHGFVNFEELLTLMKRHQFSTNVAFIPWNWRRNRPETEQLFRDNPDRYSISIHGCDHTHEEFGSPDFDLLYHKSEKALERMSAHAKETGLQHDRVMIFPHGALSEVALVALKGTKFIAAAGSEILSVDSLPRPITVGDVWNTAVVCYDQFPIFSRRSPHDEIENVAFDLLLGKPAIVSIHHDFCRDQYRYLTRFVDSINALKCALEWRTLGAVVRRSFRQRQVSIGVVEVEMYASELRLENRSGERRQYRISKRESNSAAIAGIEASGQEIEWRFAVDRVRFEVELGAGEGTIVSVAFYPLKENGHPRRNLYYEAGAMLRRYTCEFRDNYVVTNRVRLPKRVRQIIAKDSEAMSPAPGLNGSDSPIAHPLPVAQAKPRLDPSQLEQRVSVALMNFTQWLNRYGETSWDHQSYFAGSLGSRAKALYYKQRLTGTFAVAPMILSEAFVPDARRLFHQRMRLPIADAHYAMGFAFLFQANGKSADFERTLHFLDELEKSRCRGFENYCWGYPFDWVTRGGIIPRETPLITTTPYAYEAFLQAYQIDPRPGWREILASIAEHAARDIKSFPTSEKASSSSYTPLDGGGVINAAAYRAFLLTSASQLLGRDDYWEIAERNLHFVLEAQNADGSWFYATDGVRNFVDHFHTCFVLKALAKIARRAAHEETDNALAGGVDYYLRALFDEEGMPKPFAKAPRLIVYKRELYDCAECINLCLLLRDRFPQLNNKLKAVIERVLERWVKRDGSFRSRRLHLGWDNVPMHRWGQSQMFRSLASYLCEAQSRS